MMFRARFGALIRAAIAAVVVSTCLSAAILAQDSNSEWRAKINTLAAKRATRQDWGKFTSEYLNIVNADGPSDTDKSYALLCCMRMLDSIKKAKPANRGIEIFALYKKSYWGKNKKENEEAATLLVEMNLRRLTEYPEKLEEALAVIDSLENLKRDDHVEFNAQGRQLRRAQAYLAARKPEEAVRVMEDYFLTYSENPQPMAFNTCAGAYMAVGQADKALDISAKGVERFGDSGSGVEVDQVVRRFRKLIEDEQIKSDQIISLLPRIVSSRLGTQAIVSAIARIKYSEKDYTLALAYAKIDFNLSPLSKATDAVSTIGKCLMESNPDPELAARFLSLQEDGPAGPDGILGTKDDIANPIAGIASPLAPEVVEKIERELAILPEPDTIYVTLKQKGSLYLLLGRVDDALEMYRRAYSAADWSESEDAAGLLATGLKAKYGSVAAASQVMAFCRLGPAGQDNVLGTKDDIDDPLKGIGHNSIPSDLERALRAIANSKATDSTREFARQAAMRALDNNEAALVAALASRGQATKPKTIERSTKNVAASMRAIDGHCARGRQYLQSQQTGASMRVDVPTP